MSESIGPRIELKGEKEYKKALSEIKAEATLLASEMKRVAAEMQNESDAQAVATAKAEVLNKQIENQSKKVELLQGQHALLSQKLEAAQSALSAAASEYGENSIEAARAQRTVDQLTRSITSNEISMNNAAGTLADMEAEYTELTTETKAATDAQARYEAGLKKVEDAAAEAAASQEKHGAALADLDSKEKLVNSDIELANSKLKSNASEHQKSKAAAAALTAELSLQKDRRKELQSALKDQSNAEARAYDVMQEMTAEFGENSEEAAKATEEYRKQKNALNDAQAAVNSNKAKINELTTELKENKKGHSSAKEKAAEFAKALGTVASAAAKATVKLVEYTAKAAGALIGAGITGATALAKSAVEAYADYEQLVGGVETLFGTGGKSIEDYAKSVGMSVDQASAKFASLESAQSLVVANAQKAWSTVGISANDYMQNVTSFSASLISSVKGNTEEAASVADMAMQDMADNWNKFGTDQSSVMNAYQSFAKGQYNLLDNLKLGYGGTKSEMQRLLKDAQKLTGVKYDINNLADVYTAIHVIQEELGITGTTADEASKTISGSVAAAKAAYQNLLVGIADDNADFDTLVNDFVTSVTTAADNILPRFATALSGVGQLVEQLAPIISERLPGLIEQLLPPLISAGLSLAQGAIAALPSIISTVTSAIVEYAPLFISAMQDILTLVGSSLSDNAVMLAGAAADVVQQLVTFVVSNAPAMLDGALALISNLAESLLTPDNINFIVDSAVELVSKLVTFIGDNAPQMISGAVTLVLTLFSALTRPDNIGKMVDAAIALVIGIVTGLLDALPEIIAQAPVIVENLMSALIENAPKLLEAAWQLICSIASGIGENLGPVLDCALDIVETILSGIGDALVSVVAKGKEIVDSVKQGFDEKIESAKQWGKDLIQNFINGITAKWDALKNKVKSVAGSIKSIIGFSEPEEGPLSNFHTFAPDMMELFAQGIKDSTPVVTRQLKKSFDVTDLIADTINPEQAPVVPISPMSAAPQNNTSVQKTVSLGGVKFEIYAQDGQSAREIAQEVKQILYDEVHDIEEVYA